MTRAALAVCGLLLLSGCSAATAAERRDQAFQATLDAARLVCLTLLADETIPREKGVNEYCVAVVNGCPR